MIRSVSGYRRAARILLAIALSVLVAPAALGQCPASTPAEGASLPGPLPLFPSDNWWNTDISAAPLDPASANYIAFINNGGTRHLHPDFGGEVSTGSVDIYGMPYAVVDGAQAKQAVTFQYWSESDGVNASGQGVPFYPIPGQAISQPHWVEGGAPGDVDQRASSDRHLLIVDCTNKYLYELYNVYYDTTQAKWYAGSGAFFDLKTNNRRPDTWTSADAAGLAIFPGLVRYDDAWNPAITDIGHAFRVTVRATNGYVYPASHRAGSTAGALPMGARLRLKKSVGGLDPALRTSDPNAQKIFRAMQKYGLIIADNGSDMYITGTFDVRWNNGILNPAFSILTASDFEVVQLGWKPSVSGAPALIGVSASPTSVVGGNASTGTVTLSGAAPSGGASVSLGSASSAVTVPASVPVPQGATSATFGITTAVVSATTLTTLSASYGGVTKTTTFTVNPVAPPPPALSALAANPNTVVGGTASVGTVTLAAAAPAGGVLVSLSSSKTAVVVPPSVSVPQGATATTFAITTSAVSTVTSATLSAVYGGVTKTMAFTVNPAPPPPPPPPSATLASFSLNRSRVPGGTAATGTVALSAPAPSGDATIALTSSMPAVASVPASVVIKAGTTSATFTVTTTSSRKNVTATLSAAYSGVTKTTTLTVMAR